MELRWLLIGIGSLVGVLFLTPGSWLLNTIADTPTAIFHDNCQHHAHQPITDHAATVSNSCDGPGRRIVIPEMNQTSLEPIS